MAEIYRDTATSLALGISGATNVISTIIRDGVDIYESSGATLALPWKVVGYDGQFSVRWEFYMPDDPTVNQTRFEQHEVVTPLIDVDIAVADDVRAERKVRKIIETYCGQSFGYRFGTTALAGNNSELLALPQRLINLVSVNFADYPYGDPAFTNIAVVANGWALSTAYGPNAYGIKEAPPESDYYIGDAGVITVPGSRRVWTQGRTYLVAGSWGYESIPTEVAEAAQILFDDYTCDDADLRNRYVGNLRYADSRIEFNAGAFRGTGNVLADQLLSNYVKNTMVVI